MNQPYPLPREKRETEILAFDGSSVTYGPFAFKIFDTADVRVLIKHHGEAEWAETTAVTVSKTTPSEAFSTFSVTFDDVHPATSQYRVQGARLHERSSDVTKGVGLSTDAVEKELSKQGVVLDETRRDLDALKAADLRMLRAPDGETLDPLDDAATRANKVGLWSSDGKKLLAGPTATEIESAQGYATEAAAARDASQTAQGAAEEAQGDAETAAATATAKASEASSSAAAASTSASEAASSASDAESSATAAAAAKAAAEAAQTAAEAAQGAAEDAQGDAETAAATATAKASEASSSASAASTSETNAAASEAAAAASAAAAAQSAEDAESALSDATTLGGQLPSYYLDRANHTGTETVDTITEKTPGAGVTFLVPISAPAVLDRSRPLYYDGFYRGNGNDHTAAFQAALNALYESTGSYRRHLMLDGAKIVLEQTVTIPGGAPFEVRSISGGEINVSGASWNAGTHSVLIDGSGAPTSPLRLNNLTMIGGHVANWIEWDNFLLMPVGCHFHNNRNDKSPGLNGLTDAHLTAVGCNFEVSEGSVTPPSARTRVAIDMKKADQKLYNCKLAYFYNAIILRGTTNVLSGIHVYQGDPNGSNTTGHTAGIKFTGGKVGSLVQSLYLDKCFVEMSNQHVASPANGQTIGGLTMSGVKTLLNSGETSFAFVKAVDYHNLSGLVVDDVRITNGEFVNYGSALVNPTAISPAANFDRASFDDIIMENNTYIGNINKHMNPVRMKKSFASSIQHPFDLTGMLPFQARPKNVLGVTGLRSGGTAQILEIGNINASTNTVRIDTPDPWAGDITITATVNISDASGLIA